MTSHDHAARDEEALAARDADTSSPPPPAPDAMAAAAANARRSAQPGHDEAPITEDEDGHSVDNPSG